MNRLYTNTVSPAMFSLLKTLMKENALKDFRLVGGTALSLQIGHRKSVDIDLFLDRIFDAHSLFDTLAKGYKIDDPDIQTLGVFGYINDIKVDFFNHGHNWLEQPLVIEGIRMASLLEIAAMKLQAVAMNGKRLKDFVDIAFLGSYLSTDQMLKAYQEKYKTGNVLVPFRAMFYYGDIDFNQSIELVNGNFKWKIFEKRLDEMQRHTDKIFPPLQL